MKYSDVLGRSFRALKSWPLWAFSLIAVAAVAVCFGIAAALVSVIDTSGLMRLMQVPASEAAMLRSMLRLYAVMIVGGLLALPVMLVVYAGFIHMADSVLAGRPVTAGEGWSFGFRRAGRLLGIEAILYLFYALGMIAVMAPFMALVIFGAATSENGGAAGLIGSICLGYLWLFAGIIVLMVVYTGVEGLSTRYGLVGDRKVIDAVSSGWKAFRVRWKNVVVFGLIMVGLMYAWSFVTSIITTPLMLFAMPFSTWTASEPSPDALAGMMDSMLWLYALMFLLTTPAYIFMAVGWTAFFRQLTGLDTPPPSYYATTPQPPAYPPAPPQEPPAPPQEPPAYPPTPPRPPAGPSGE